MKKKLSPEELRLTYDPLLLPAHSTETIQPSEGIIGQHRAVSALQFGLTIQETGFNIYVAGPRGIGKMTAVKAYVEDMASARPTPDDWCYLNNFEDAFEPVACRLPAGMGKQFQQDMRHLVDQIRREVPRIFESDEYNARRESITRKAVEERDEIVQSMNQRAAEADFMIQATPTGLLLIPIRNGQPLNDEDWNAFSDEQKTAILQTRDRLQQELKDAIKSTRLLERKTEKQLADLDQQTALFYLSPLLDELRDRYIQQPAVLKFLQDIQNDLIQSLDLLRSDNAQDPGMMARREALLKRYAVNLLVDQSRSTGAPVVVEMNPTYNNLFGRIEKESAMGTLYTDFTMIKAGALHKANGGFLVLPIEDVLKNFMSWDSLKRALKSREIRIEELSENLGMTANKSLRPQPIPLQVKVILIGRPVYYYLLHSQDEEFPELFRVRADFDTTMARTASNIRDFIAFLSMLCSKEKLRHLDRGGIAKMLEYASRFAEDQEKLSTHFGAMADVLREAHYWASQDGSEYITANHVRKALNEIIYRSSQIQERFQEMIARDILKITTEGKVVGQINALSVIRMGETMFGKPSRITATVTPGNEGIIDIEKQVALGGPIHSKGVLILHGLLMRLFGKHQKFSLSARLVFEQSYEGVDGDSASAAEFFAILSALAGAPLDQGIAVTGSINQNGEIQAVGGINAKIEGFYDICCVRGLNGKQGVIIPYANKPHLMIREDVVEAVSKKIFHVWTIDSFEDGIEILTGKKAGKAGAFGRFPPNTVLGMVQKQLQQFHEVLFQTSKKKLTRSFIVKRSVKKQY